MKRHRSHNLIMLSLLLCTLCAVLCGCGAADRNSPAEKTVLTVWCTKGSACAKALFDTAKKFNSLADSELPYISISFFRNEAALAAAMNESMPDFLLCSSSRIPGLEKFGHIGELDDNIICEGILLGSAETISDRVGTGVFPIAIDVQCALYKSGYFGESAPKSLKELCLRAEEAGERDELCFSTDSFADIFMYYMCGLGRSFNGGSPADRYSAEYKSVYNMLGGAAFSHGTAAFNTECLPLLNSGQIDCLLNRSARFSGENTDGYSASVIANADGGGEVCGDLICLVLMKECEQTGAAELFLKSIYSEESAAELALSGSCAPCVLTKLTPGNELERVLIEVSYGENFSFVSSGSEYYSARDRFEAEIRSELNSLW